MPYVPFNVPTNKGAPIIWHDVFPYTNVTISRRMCCGSVVPITGEGHGVLNLDNNEFFTYEFVQRCWSLRCGRRCVSFNHELGMWSTLYRERGFPAQASRMLLNSDRVLAVAFSFRAMQNPNVNSLFKCRCAPGNQCVLCYIFNDGACFIYYTFVSMM